LESIWIIKAPKTDATKTFPANETTIQKENLPSPEEVARCLQTIPSRDFKLQRKVRNLFKPLNEWTWGKKYQ